MDTDDLSNEAYKAVIIEAEKFNHDLTLYFGALASHCKNETEYLKKSKELIEEIKDADESYLDDMFFGEIPNLKALSKCLDKMLINIAKVENIPEKERHFEF